MAMKGFSAYPKLEYYWSITIRLLNVISWTLVWEVLPLCEMQTVHSTTLANWAKRNLHHLTEKEVSETSRSRRYPTKIITVADYADDIAILANTHNQAETLLYSLEQTNAGIGLHFNAHKTEYMCFNQTGDISTLDRTSLKLDTASQVGELVYKFTYLGSSI